MIRFSKKALFIAGTIALAAASSRVLADGDAARGEKVFEQCAACHSMERGAHMIGPTLYGVFGRKAGELADYRYSPALKRSGITWTPQTMDDFVADPQKAVPGNRAPFSGVSDPADRADLIAYLLKATR